MMKKLYDDAAYQDVSFIFNGTGMELEDPPTQTMKIGAHKHVLAQWPYFKSMFEGGFAESGEGAKQIQIKDVKPATFRLMIQFMYMGHLVKEEEPKTVFTDALENEEEARGLATENAIPFLFRSAYLYGELRAPVVKYAATSCVSAIASKDFRSNYLTHPEFGALLHELFIEK
ncbi:hypothetical protein BGZ74_002407 [Mortierella antarctica]|nr:hypothetical protein BGZ74_002407 [Mortierella antarctica]